MQNFLIVGVQRTGSSALAEMIDSHSEIAVGWEWTESTSYAQKMSRLESYLGGDFSTLRAKAKAHIQASMTPQTSALGFRRLFGASHLWAVHPRWSAKLFYDRFNAHLRWLRRHPETHLVHIIRNDHVSWLKSKFVTREAGSYVGTSHPSDLQVNIPIEEAVKRVQSKMWVDSQLAKLANTNPYLAISYEEFANNLPQLATQVAEFLNCDPTLINPESTTIRKQSDRSDSDYISNYSELLEALEHAQILNLRTAGAR